MTYSEFPVDFVKSRARYVSTRGVHSESFSLEKMDESEKFTGGHYPG